MKIIFLGGFANAKKTYKAKDIEDFSPEIAIKLIDGGIAKPKVKKEYVELKAKLEASKVVEEENRVKAYAIMKQDELKESVELLKKELESTLELIDDDEFKQEFGSKLDVVKTVIAEMVGDIEAMSSEELKEKYKVQEPRADDQNNEGDLVDNS